MQYVRSFGGSVSKTWNSLNPATLSGAIDVIVVEQADGSLACSPFHVRFGKISLLRPYDKKVEFKVNDVKQSYSMKLGEGGEAFFVFETSAEIPESLQTSPLVSPAASPSTLLSGDPKDNSQLQEPEFLDLSASGPKARPLSTVLPPHAGPFMDEMGRARSDIGNITPLSSSPNEKARPGSRWSSGLTPSPPLMRSTSVRETQGEASKHSDETEHKDRPKPMERTSAPNLVPLAGDGSGRSSSPPPLSSQEAFDRAMALSKKLSETNIPTHVTETGDLMLDMNGYKSSEDDALRAEIVARKVLSEELDGNYDIGALIAADEQGNVWIYSSEEAKEAALRKLPSALEPRIDDAASDPGYHSDEDRLIRDSVSEMSGKTLVRSSIDLEPPVSAPPRMAGDPNLNYAKTLRLTSDQLKALNLKPGENSMSFTVNKATYQASMFLWNYSTPVVISDIDGTITKSDALGHVLNMIGRDWTHIGVAKLYTDIVANGYNILYLTSRSVGQADTTRNYLHSVVQDGFKLPKGPVILSPDRTVAALRREVYLRKPEVFKMACLRDIMNLFGENRNAFYAGFGNRFTDALSYRSVNIPSSRIFTINSNAEVSLDLLTLSKYRSSYVSMQEILDHFFPPVGLLVAGGGENYTDFSYWREAPLELDDFSASDSDEASDQDSVHNTEDEGSEGDEEGYEDEDEDDGDPMVESFMSQDSLDEGADLIDSVNRGMKDSMISRSGRSGSVSSSAPSNPPRTVRGRQPRSPGRPTSR